MLLKSLSLTNMRSYDNLSIEFPPGYVLFKGDVGSGKSTILMAIEFALFGLGSIKADSLISKKAQRCEVALKFEVDGTGYEVGRAINKKDTKSSQDPTSSYLVQDNARDPLTPSDLKAKVLEILNFNEPPNPRALSRVYRYAVYTPQEEIKSILEDRVDREETIRKAFGMEDYKTAAENAGLLITQLTSERDKLSGLFSHLDEDESRLEKVRLEVHTIKQDLSGLQAKKTALGGRKNGMDSEMSDMRSQIDELNRMQAEKDRIENDAANQKANLEKFRNMIKKDNEQIQITDRNIQECRLTVPPTEKTRNEIEGMRKNAIEMDRRIHVTGSQMDQHRKELDELHGKLGDRNAQEMQELVDHLMTDIAADEGAIQDADKTIQDEASRAGEKTNEIKTLADSLDKASSLGLRCEYCDSALNPDYVDRLQNDRRAMLDVAQAELDTIIERKKQAEDKAREIRDRLDGNRHLLTERQRAAEAAGRVSVLEQEVSRLEADLTLLRGANTITPEESFPSNPGESAHDYLSRLLDALTKHEAAVERETLLLKQRQGLADRITESEESCEACMESIRLLQLRAEDLAKDLTRREGVDQSMRTLQDNLNKIQADLLEVAENISSKMTLLGRLGEDAERLQNDIAEAKKHRARYKMCGDYAEWLREYFVPSLREVEREVMNSLRYDFNDFYSQWYSELVEDPTKRSYIDERFGPVIQQDGYQQEFAYLSGGEKTSVALAYRLALNSTMRRQAGALKSNLLILDEPTDGFSKSQLGKVRTILASLRSEQVIMVSHEEELEGYVDHVFDITKSEGVSTVVPLR